MHDYYIPLLKNTESDKARWEVEQKYLRTLAHVKAYCSYMNREPYFVLESYRSGEYKAIDWDALLDTKELQ